MLLKPAGIRTTM